MNLRMYTLMWAMHVFSCAYCILLFDGLIHILVNCLSIRDMGGANANREIQQ